MTAKRIYVISMAASGKSTFARNNPTYNGCRVVDYAQELPTKSPWTKFVLYLSRALPILRRAVRRNKDLVAINRINYFEGVLDLFEQSRSPTAVMGRRLPENFKSDPRFASLTPAVVLIPEEDHRRNCAARRKEMRNPLPFMHHWTTDFDKVRRVREQTRSFAERHGIPVFDSFGDAIDTLAGPGPTPDKQT